MYYEFPHDPLTYGLGLQFMFGDSMLIAPKYGEPDVNNQVYHTPYEISVYLPYGINWYYFYSGMPIAGAHNPYTVPIARNEQGVWV